MSRNFTDPETCVDAIIARVGKSIVLGAPIGLGKPVHLLNALYHRASADPSMSLRIVTGLSIGRPKAQSDIEKRFMDPIVERLFGDFPEPAYVEPYKRNTLPPNIEVVEFYMNAGGFLNDPAAQHHYISTNYTHVGRDMLIQGVNVFAQSVGKRGEGDAATYSLSSNSDSLSLFPDLRAAEAAGRPMAIIGQVNRQLPFMTRDAEVGPETFDFLLDDPKLDHAIFASPSPPVGTVDHVIGLYASALIPDGGTIQIGIGSLGDAIAAACGLRQRDNAAYLEALDQVGVVARHGDLVAAEGGTGRFDRGLYASTEMFADCFRALYEDGVLKREVFDDPVIQRLSNDHDLRADEVSRALDLLLEDGAIAASLGAHDLAFLQRVGVFSDSVRLEGDTLLAPDGARISADLSNAVALSEARARCLGPRLKNASVLHGGFYLGPHRMYDMLRELDPVERDKFVMTGIGFVNQLYGNEPLASLQRRGARFVNTTMMMTLMGAACSDGLESGQVVSGVGGQYNFVAMAHALEGGRSVLTLRSSRTKDGEATSNIVWNYGHITIPRHLRDIVITEYGVADLRGRQDHEVIARLLNITDSAFQEGLREQAVAAGKLSADYRIPDAHRQNTPARLEAALAPLRAQGHFGTFPLGTDLTQEEQVLGRVLKGLKAKMGRIGGVARLLTGAIGVGSDTPAAAKPYLARMGLERPEGLRETMLRRMIVEELVAGGHI